jgi:hypothetical protein
MFRRSFLTAALGLAAGTACSRSPSKNAMPRIILAPLFGVWLGLGIASKVALGISLVFFVVFYNVHQGVRQVDPVVLASVRMLVPRGARWCDTWFCRARSRSLRLPAQRCAWTPAWPGWSSGCCTGGPRSSCANRSSSARSAIIIAARR